MGSIEGARRATSIRRYARKAVKTLILPVCIAALTLTACGPQLESEQTIAPDPAADDRPVVLTTFTVLADIAQNVAGEHIRVESITKVGAEIHSYEPSPGDLRTAAEADLILDNGLKLEAWFEKFVAGLDVPHVVASEGVEPIAIGAGEAEGAPNPHAWMSLANVQIYVDNIAEAFSDLAPEHAESFAQNADGYKGELVAIEHTLRESISEIPERQRALVTCEGAFSYLARDAGLSEQYIWAVNAERQATPKQVVAVIEFVRENDVPAVFCESTVSSDSMQRVVEETGSSFGGTLYVDSLSAIDGPVPTYLDLIEHDVNTIIDGLTERTQ